MPVNTNTDLTLSRYSRTRVPNEQDNIPRFLSDELQRIENALRDMADAAIQAVDSAPPEPRSGMVRFNILPWNPLGNNAQQLVVYNGTSWVAV